MGHPNTDMRFWKHITTVSLTSELSVGVKFPHTFSHVDAITAAVQTENRPGAQRRTLSARYQLSLSPQPGPGASRREERSEAAPTRGNTGAVCQPSCWWLLVSAQKKNDSMGPLAGGDGPGRDPPASRSRLNSSVTGGPGGRRMLSPHTYTWRSVAL